MGKIPYLFRRKNVFYFRLVIPIEHQSLLDFQQITISLKTQDKEEAIPQALKLASHLKTFLQDLKAGRTAKLSRPELIASATDTNSQQIKRLLCRFFFGALHCASIRLLAELHGTESVSVLQNKTCVSHGSDLATVLHSSHQACRATRTMSCTRSKVVETRC